ncbi:MAG: thioesterase [Ignavibacteriaceae bacterium]|nr:thioesterase [Ignavibacteriaceae bacterium]
MGSFFEESKPVNAYDVDINNKLKLNTLFSFLQDVASSHADSLSLGYNDLIAKDLGWVLSWAKLQVEEYPSFGEIIKIRTWPKCRYKLYSMREFLIYNENDKLLYSVSTAWLLINVKTKRITDIKNLPQQIYYQPDFQALNDFPERIIIDKEKETLFSKRIRYTDLDINRHVNNTKYIELILDSYPPDYHKNNLLDSLTVSFIAESFYDDEMDIRIAPKGFKDKYDVIDGVNKKTSKQVFQALVGWRIPELK